MGQLMLAWDLINIVIHRRTWHYIVRFPLHQGKNDLLWTLPSDVVHTTSILICHTLGAHMLRTHTFRLCSHTVKPVSKMLVGSFSQKIKLDLRTSEMLLRDRNQSHTELHAGSYVVQRSDMSFSSSPPPLIRLSQSRFLSSLGGSMICSWQSFD